MRTLYEMPLEPPEDLAHARWRVRFFRHLVEEHRTHPHPGVSDDHWASEDASYADHLSRAEAALAGMEVETETGTETEMDTDTDTNSASILHLDQHGHQHHRHHHHQKPPPERNTLDHPSPDWHERRVQF